MRIAFLSPLTPKPSGIADYSEALLPHLAALVEHIDVFIEDDHTAFTPSASNLRIRNYVEFEPDHKAGKYDVVLYQMGNNPFHGYVYNLALRIPGVVTLHEFNLHYLIAATTLAHNDWDAYLREAEYNGGQRALELARQARAGLRQIDYDGLAMNRRLLEQSRGVVVHSDYMTGLVRGAGYPLPMRKIPHGVAIQPIDAAQARSHLTRLAGFAIAPDAPVFGVFGFLKPYKRIRESLRAFARLRNIHPAAKMILVGEEHPHYALRPLIDELGIGDAVRILGYVPLDIFDICIAACDVCINLRRPTAGETSGSFLRALALGKPALVSEIGAFVELPDDIAVKIPVDHREEDWVFEYIRALVEDRELAQAIGTRAQEHALRECAWPKVAAEYVAFLAEFAPRRSSGATPAKVPLPANGTAVASRNPAQTASEIENYIFGFCRSSPLMEEYALTHRKRLVRTIELTPRAGPGERVLELGCYMQLTPALGKLGYGEVRGAYYGRVGERQRRSATSAAGEVFGCEIDLFDAEKDRFPYADGYFKTVLCCELIEHLPNDPMHMVAEINRVLADGGYFLLSTPNIASYRGIHAILHGYHPGLFPAYIKPSQDGTVDPRHSREYTPREVAVLMQAGGFHVEHLETGEYGADDEHAAWTEQFLQRNQCSAELRGAVIYCLGRKTGPVQDRWPKDLYYPP